jgi:putative DNA primase/helicase
MKNISLFKNFMDSKGLPCPDILADNKIHRFRVSGDRPGSKNGWYVFYNDNGLPAGAFGSWKLGQTFTWCGKEQKQLSEPERVKWQERIAEAQKAREKEQRRLHLAAKKRALKIWNAAEPVESHPYLTAKGIESVPLEVRALKSHLILPIYNIDGELCSLQSIDPKGNKKFLPGGLIKSNFISIPGPKEENISLVCEGFVTGITSALATGYPAFCALNCGNLKAVAEALHKRMPNIKIIVLADDDHATAGNPGLTKAREAAQKIGAALVVPRFRDPDHRGTDFNDLAQAEGLDVVRDQIENALRAQPAPEPADSISPEVISNTIEHLATLPPCEYEAERVSMAKKLKVRISFLDAEVQRLRDNAVKKEGLVEELEPWEDPVSGDAILKRILNTISQYIVLPWECAVTISLWVMLSYCYEDFRVLPLLAFTSPEKRCGKTRSLELLSGLVNRAFSSSNLTPATLYRVIEKCKPTLLVDELDTFLPRNDELRGVLNCGHSRKNAFISRCNAETNEPERFNCFGPKAVALIGKLPPTLEDRSLTICLKRKLASERVKPLSLDFDDQARELRQKCLKWSLDNEQQLKLCRPEMPRIENDRALDNWTPLFAIAEVVGGRWPEEVKKAMLALEASKTDESAKIKLLKDIRTIFGDFHTEKISTQALLDELLRQDHGYWLDFRRGKPLSKKGLAILLRDFDIKNEVVREGVKTLRVYAKDDFQDVFDRYLS